MSLKTTIALIVIAAIVGGVVYWNPFRKEATATPEPPWFYNISMNDIDRIDVNHLGQRLSFHKYTPAKWYFEAPERVSVDLDRWGGITLLLSGPQSRRLLADTVDDPGKYGLTDPATIIDVTLQGERTIQVRLGDKTPDGVSHYAQMGGFPQLFLVDATWGDVLSRLVTEPPFPKWYFQMDPQLVVALTVLHNGKEVAFKKDEEAGWRFDDEDKSPLDQERWSNILPLLAGPSSIKVVTEEPDDVAAYGLAESPTEISIKFKTFTESGTEYNEVIVLLIGDKAPDGSGYYVQTSGFQPIVLFDISWSEALAALAEDPPYATDPQVSRIYPAEALRYE